MLRQQMQERELEERRSQGDFDADTFRLEYMNKVSAAAKAYGIEALAELEVPKLGNSQISFIDRYRQFLADVDHIHDSNQNSCSASR